MEAGPEGGSDIEAMLDTEAGTVESDTGFADTAEPAAAAHKQNAMVL